MDYKQEIGIYPGSFDPWTFGHQHVARGACKFFSKVIILITVNDGKDNRRIKDMEAMKQAILESCKQENLENVEVSIGSKEELTVDFAQKVGSEWLIRGVRGVTDYGYEEDLAQINEELALENSMCIDTMYLRAGKTRHISSSAAISLFLRGRDVSKWVPKPIVKMLNIYYKR